VCAGHSSRAKDTSNRTIENSYLIFNVLVSFVGVLLSHRSHRSTHSKGRSSVYKITKAKIFFIATINPDSYQDLSDN
jgi:hypothetical protein